MGLQNKMFKGIKIGDNTREEYLVFQSHRAYEFQLGDCLSSGPAMKLFFSLDKYFLFSKQESVPNTSFTSKAVQHKTASSPHILSINTGISSHQHNVRD